MCVEFGREVCGYLNIAESKEWLVTNGIGGYASGTVGGLLTRRYHGLLVASLNPPLGRTLMLAKLDDTAVYGEQLYPLFTNRWTDGTVSPHGYLHIERFFYKVLPLHGVLLVLMLYWKNAFGCNRVQTQLMFSTHCTVQRNL